MSITIEWEDFFNDNQAKKIRNEASGANLPPIVYIMTVFSENWNRTEKSPPSVNRGKEQADGEITLDSSFKDLDINTRGRNALDDNTDIETVRDLLGWSEEQLLEVNQFGQTSLDYVEEALNRHGFEVGQYHGEDDELIEQQEEPEENPPQKEVAEQIRELDTKKSNVQTIIKIWTEATGRDKKDAAKVMKNNGFNPKDPDTYQNAWDALVETLPVSQSQKNDIYRVAERLQESHGEVNERAEAMFGKPVDSLNYGEANKMYREMIKDEESDKNDVEEKTLEGLPDDVDGGEAAEEGEAEASSTDESDPQPRGDMEEDDSVIDDSFFG